MDYVIITNRFWNEFEVTREQADIFVKQWDIKAWDVREKWEIVKQVVVESPKAPTEQVEQVKLSDLTIEDLRKEFFDAFWKEVPNNMKNNPEYIKKQLLSLIK